MKRWFWKFVARRWRKLEAKWTLAAYAASAWDEQGRVSELDRELYREAKEQEEHCRRKAAECESRAARPR